MFPKFDPYDRLMELSQECQHLQEVNKQVIEALKQLQVTEQRIIHQLNQQTQAINALDENQQNHDGRLRLMEIARQYEDQTTPPRN